LTMYVLAPATVVGSPMARALMRSAAVR
jgi:hypothetical protein